MLSYAGLLLLVSRVVSGLVVTERSKCPIVTSCSPEAADRNIDSCCVPKPGGLFIFRQKLVLDVADEMGNWGIAGLDVLDCDSSKPLNSAVSPSFSAEEIASQCLKSRLFGGEKGFAKAEQEWAHAELGEGVEEVWERVWSSAGRYISTLAADCLQDQDEAGVPLFFNTLHRLHEQLPAAKLLADADIIPASDTTYSLLEIQAGLSAKNYTALITCDGDTLSSIAWPLTVRGTFQTGHFEPYAKLDMDLDVSNCPKEGINYPSSFHAPKPKVTDKWDPIFRPQPRALKKSHDASRLYNHPDDAAAGERVDPVKLEFFKEKDQDRDENFHGVKRQFRRDEL